MQVYAPIPEQDIDALKREIQRRMPAELDAGRRDGFVESASTVVKSLNVLNDVPLNYLASIAQLRTYYSRLEPWQPTFDLLAAARDESTKGLYRALHVMKDYLQSKEPRTGSRNPRVSGEIRIHVKRTGSSAARRCGW